MEGCGAFEAWISCKAWLVCRALLLFILGSVRSCKRRWFSGKISRCQRDAPGSIPGRRILFAASPFWAHSRPQHAFWRSGIASQASGRPPWTSYQAQVASTADRPPAEAGSWSA
ncbi:hypothetical protein PF003_g40952 [Phytophthora fragariae]|nr:hypothetical protein PF003_g40952 [Phytophthora fragariae]